MYTSYNDLQLSGMGFKFIKRKKKLQVCQHNIERSMLNFKRKDKVNMNVFRHKTKTVEIPYKIKKLKLKWAVIRSKINKWAKQVAE